MLVVIPTKHSILRIVVKEINQLFELIDPFTYFKLYDVSAFCIFTTAMEAVTKNFYIVNNDI